MPIELSTPKTRISLDSGKRIQRHLNGLEKRLANFHNANVHLTIRDRPTERRHTADAVVALGVDGVELASHHSGESAEHAARLAIEDIERQLEKYVATLRGESSFGTPSRREPRDMRPANQAGDEDDYDAPPDLDAESDDE